MGEGIEMRAVVGLLWVIAQVSAWLSKRCRGIRVWGGRERLGAETGADRSGFGPPAGCYIGVVNLQGIITIIDSISSREQ